MERGEPSRDNRGVPESLARRVLHPLTSATTYRCGVYLLLGAVVLLPYVLLSAAFVKLLTTQAQQRPWLIVLLVVTLLIAVGPAFLAGVRSLEISAARELLGARVELPTGAVSAGARMRSALWYVVTLVTGGLLAAALFLGVPTALIFIAQRFGSRTAIVDTSGLGFLSGVDPWLLLVLGVAVLTLIPYITAAMGAGLHRLAPILLGPSAEERIAALEARAHGLAERNRLARDLHDSLGHALTITTVQAAAAREVADSDPAFVGRALAAIEEAGRIAMADLDHVLGLLRAGEAASTMPQRDLDDLPRLVEETRAAGATISTDLASDLDAVTPAVSREGYRIVQEALTNAIRHARGKPVELRVGRSGESLAIDVSNPMLDSDADVESERSTMGPGGRGLTGMAERVRVLGGDLDAGRRNGQWRVSARLPGQTMDTGR